MYLPSDGLRAEQAGVACRLQKVTRIACGPGHGPHALAQLVLDLRFKLLLQLSERGRLKK
jgi:hypothetical protein